MYVIPAVSYLFTGLAGCSVGPGISCGARKLARTHRVTKKKSYDKILKSFFFFQGRNVKQNDGGFAGINLVFFIYMLFFFFYLRCSVLFQHLECNFKIKIHIIFICSFFSFINIFFSSFFSIENQNTYYFLKFQNIFTTQEKKTERYVHIVFYLEKNGKIKIAKRQVISFLGTLLLP
jgi:hypothetical protein